VQAGTARRHPIRAEEKHSNRRQTEGTSAAYYVLKQFLETHPMAQHNTAFSGVEVRLYDLDVVKNGVLLDGGGSIFERTIWTPVPDHFPTKKRR
jgi:hypothetical protein